MTLWVVKVGTSIIRGNKYRPTANFIEDLCNSISACKDKGDRVILVSSGAVGLGCHQLAIGERPKDLVSLQAAAAVGQGYLMHLYELSMGRSGYKVGQILLTRAELSSRESYKNASLTLKRLLDWDVLPIINENDTLSDEELRYGDNDTLSALVAVAVKADHLILLTDIDKLYSADPRLDSNAEPIFDVHHYSQIKTLDTNNLDTDWGTGGIKTKLTAARIACDSGITVQLSDGTKPEILREIFKGCRMGTIFHPNPNPIKNKKSWLVHALEPIGQIYLDEGACEAIKHKGASLLLVGIEKVTGDFSANQPVKVFTKNGEEIARGICSQSSEFLRKSLDGSTNSDKSPVVIHRDVLALTDDITS